MRHAVVYREDIQTRMLNKEDDAYPKSPQSRARLKQAWRGQSAVQK